jgi:hypothetical protein
MHFRSRNRVIQVIRTTYDPITKKPRAQVLGSVDKVKPDISEELRLTCKPQELAELKAYLKNQQQLAQLELEMAARSLVSQMNKAAEWLDTATVTTENVVLATEINGQLPKLRKQLARLLKNAEAPPPAGRTSA